MDSLCSSLAKQLAAASLCLLTAAAAVAAPGAVEVRFVQPEKFADAEETQMDRERVLATLEEHLKLQAGKRVAAGQSLLVEVLDLNLAGEIEPFGHLNQRVRVLRGIGWPKMKLHYVLREGDKALREADADLSDMAYLDSQPQRYPSGEPLRYEKRMIDEWLAREFPVSAAAGTRP